MTRFYLTVAEVRAMHADQIARYGGVHGVRDPGGLEAAVFRPQSGYYPDTIAEAAALWESLSQNHPFLDGNKRTAFAAVYTFLAINGIAIAADAETAWRFLHRLCEAGGFCSAALDAWLREHTAPIQPVTGQR